MKKNEFEIEFKLTDPNQRTGIYIYNEDTTVLWGERMDGIGKMVYSSFAVRPDKLDFLISKLVEARDFISRKAADKTK